MLNLYILIEVILPLFNGLLPFLDKIIFFI